MKATAFFLLILCTCALGASAGPIRPSSAPAVLDTATFLESLRGPEPVEAAARRGVQTKSACTVTLQCDVGAGGASVQCSSPNGNCFAGGNYVECDGTRYNCPSCYASVDCCFPGDTLDCYGYSSCSKQFRSVTCDGVTYRCGPIRYCSE
ncbi:MAG TPA: hypothetical protein VHC97_07405 [Thermoanaerobaculia bacterium]|jgi:hypothetical protein|nr:hypothetical protein [Thermoanaerobaculia bacterium]